MAAAKAAAEEDNQGSDEKHGEYPNASRSHVPIVAAARHFDKVLVKMPSSGTLYAHATRCGW
jgi:hypothetical protein